MALAICALVVVFVSSNGASAHVIPVPQSLTTTMSFAVPNERREPMSGVTISVPAGFRIVRAHPLAGWAASWRAVAARPSGFVRRAAENKDGVSPVESGRTSRCEGARLRCVLAGSAGAAVWAVQEPLDQWVFRSHYSDVAVLGKVAIGGRAWWPAGLALHLVNGAVFGLVYCEARRRWPQRPRRLAMSMALGEHVALYPLSYFVDRFHPRRGTRGIPPLLENPRAFAQATWRHTIFGLVLGRLA